MRHVVCLVILSISSYGAITHTAQFRRDAGFWSCPHDEVDIGFFNKLTDGGSQREDWYAVTPYIAEFWCTVSNIPFFYVGAKHASPEVFFAGVASAASHAIPHQWLHTADLVGVGAVALKVARSYRVIYDNSWLIAPLAGAGIINAVDAYLSRNYGYTWPHVLWHITAAACMDMFLTCVDEHQCASKDDISSQ